MSASPGEELVEWVDEHDHVIGVVTRARMRAENLRHRSVAIVVTTADGQLLVHRRADTKDVLPGWWDVAAGGVVAAGESYADAARRELAEEVGITGVEPRWVGHGIHEDGHAREICHVFRVVHGGPYVPVDGEVAELRLVTPIELGKLLTEYPFVPSGLHLVLPLVADLGPHGRFHAGDASRTLPSVDRVEFTIEPFVEGRPGPHVTRAIDAVRSMGVDVEIGPFGSACETEATQTPDVVAAIVRTALEHGASHVNLDVSAGGDS